MTIELPETTVDAKVRVEREVLTSSGERQPISLAYARCTPWPLDVRFADGSSRHFREWTLWHNVLKLREELESVGSRLLCVASLPNVVVSGMLLDMLGGQIVYRVHMGQIARSEDQIEVFQPAAPGDVGTVADQNYFKAQWLGSSRKQNGS